MKKMGLVLVMGLSLLLVGCGSKEKDYEEIMKAYADEYFKTYAAPYLKQLTTDGKEVFMMDIYEVTVANIRNVNNNGGGDFDMAKLDGCSDDSRVDLMINRETSTITKYEYHLECE